MGTVFSAEIEIKNHEKPRASISLEERTACYCCKSHHIESRILFLHTWCHLTNTFNSPYVFFSYYLVWLGSLFFFFFEDCVGMVILLKSYRIKILDYNWEPSNINRERECVCMLTENGRGGLWVLPWEESLCCPAAQPHLPLLLLPLYLEHLNCQNYNGVPEINENVLFNEKFRWKLHFSFLSMCSPHTPPPPAPRTLQLNDMVEEGYIDVSIGKDFKALSVVFQIIL